MRRDYKEREAERRDGPRYDVSSASLAKWRFRARDGLATLTRDDRKAYGAAVEAAVLAKHRALLRSHGETMPTPRCASGTWINTSDGAIGDAVRQQHRQALLACPAVERRKRTPLEWERMYREAMPKGFVPSWELESVKCAA